MLDQALIGSTLTGVLALLAQAVSKCKCYVACKKDGEGEYCEPQCACGFQKEMRHYATQNPRHPSTLDRVASAWDTGTKLYGLARGAYTIGKAAAPYVAALL